MRRVEDGFVTQSGVEKELASGQRQMSAGFGTDYLKAPTCKGNRIKNKKQFHGTFPHSKTAIAKLLQCCGFLHVKGLEVVENNLQNHGRKTKIFSDNNISYFYNIFVQRDLLCVLRGTDACQIVWKVFTKPCRAIEIYITALFMVCFSAVAIKSINVQQKHILLISPTKRNDSTHRWWSCYVIRADKIIC